MNKQVIPGTDPDIINMYLQMAEMSSDVQLSLLENDVIVLDTETTGLNPKTSSLIEIAALRLSGSKVVDEFHTFVDPGTKIPKEITELTGIVQDDVKGAPSPRQAVARFTEFVDGLDLVAHNAPFDRDFIMANAMPGEFMGRWIDTLALSQIVLPRMKSHRLVDLASAFGLARPTHRATDDTACLAELWRILLAGIQLMKPGLANRIAELSPLTDWPLRHLFEQAALQYPGVDFSLRRDREDRTKRFGTGERMDACEKPLVFDDETVIEKAFSPSGIAGEMYEDFETRDAQLAMAEEVHACLQNGDIRVIEAGTGVGKSMAYLVPVALFAKKNEVTMGVATKTNTLMDQLVYNELPRLADAMGGLTYMPLKGYDHYLCLRKLESFARNERSATPQVVNMMATLLSFTAQTTYGDLDALNIGWARLPRAEMHANPHDCLKKRCPFFGRKCFLHGARRIANQADIVVTNHALVFADMQADNGILPPIRHWIIDEAHSVENEARRQLSSSFTSRDLETACMRIAHPKGGIIERVRKNADKLDGGTLVYGVTADIDKRVSNILLDAAEFFESLTGLASSTARDSRNYNTETVWISKQTRSEPQWEPVRKMGLSLADRIHGLIGRLLDLVSTLEQFEGEFVSQLAELSAIASEMRNLHEALVLVVNGDDDRYVYSLELDRNPRFPMQGLEAMRLDVGETLVEDLYSQVRSLVYTSATLSNAEHDPFAHFMHACGLDREHDKPVHASIFASSYDYDRNMTILLPKGMPDPNSREYHDAFAELLLQVHKAMGGSVLTLFTNRREMESFYRELKPQLAEAGIDLIAQTRGTSTKNIRDRFLSDKNLSLFALKSFWEGFDAPGDTLRCVIIARLPFARPNDPLAREREERSGRAAWGKFSLPEAVMDLKQAAGRLIRNSTDSGWLVLTDSRLQTKNYAKSFLRAMPTTDIRTLSVSEIAKLMETSEPGMV